MAIFISVVLLVVVVSLLTLFLGSRDAPDYPPGPFAWPVIGNLFSIVGGDGFYSKILGLRQIHGDIFRLKLGKLSMIVIFGLRNIKEVLVEKGDMFKNRPNWLHIPANVIGNKGIFWTNGSVWYKLTNLLIKTQKDSERQLHLQEEILTEIKETYTEIKQAKGTSLNPTDMMTRSVFNITATIALGKRFDHNDPEFKLLWENIVAIMVSGKSASPANMFPLVAWLASSKFEETRRKEAEVFDFLRRILLEHKETLDPDHPMDFMDVFLCLSEEERNQEEYSESSFFRGIIDLFLGGADTSTSMLLWHLVYMSKYQDVQRRCQEEIDKVVGGDRQVTVADRDSLPYTNATLMELGRAAGTIVNTALRTNTEETMIGKFRIPKDSIIVCDLRQPHINKEFWEDPEDFRPERFFESTKDKPYHPFGLGPRQCVAQTAADSMLFLFLTSLLQTFHVQGGDPQQSDDNVSLDGYYTGVSLRPKLDKFKFTPRD